jgi:hypothetical protein
LGFCNQKPCKSPLFIIIVLVFDYARVYYKDIKGDIFYEKNET